jgi:hypothetical protein
MRLLRCLFCLVPILLASKGFSQGVPQPGAAIKKPLIYQIGQIVHINATGSRPLLQAVDALQEKYGWIVEYEDPQYPAAIGGTPTQPSGPVRRHPMARADGTSGFSTQFNAGPTPNSRPDERTVLALIVDANNQSNDAGQFELRKEKDGSFVVDGVGVRSPQGETSSQQPILDSLISLEAERRSARETIALICQKVSQLSKIQVTANDAADSLSGRAIVVVGGADVQARTLLSRTLASMGRNLYWRLLYDSSAKSYELSISSLSQ